MKDAPKGTMTMTGPGNQINEGEVLNLGSIKVPLILSCLKMKGKKGRG